MPKRRKNDIYSDHFVDEYDDEDSNSNSSSHPPIQRNAANARERARMRVLSSAFSRLKTKLPNIPADTKLSKLDTLRLATIYIQQLKSLLDGEPDGPLHFNQQQNLTWPFTFQQITGASIFSNQHHIIDSRSHKSQNSFYDYQHNNYLYEPPDFNKM